MNFILFVLILRYVTIMNVKFVLNQTDVKIKKTEVYFVETVKYSQTTDTNLEVSKLGL